MLDSLNLRGKSENVLEKCLSDPYQHNDGIKKRFTHFPLYDLKQVKNQRGFKELPEESRGSEANWMCWQVGLRVAFMNCTRVRGSCAPDAS